MAATHDRPLVSVVLPVFNPGQLLLSCLESLDQQELVSGELEVVAVDDGSTDGSGRRLDAYAQSRPWVRVLHQANSGWPGRPRNRGIENSTGRYLFFLDADDRLAPGALRHLCDYAQEHDTDLLIPGVKRTGAASGYIGPRMTAIPCPLATAVRSVWPQKLFRRDMIETHGVRFPEGQVRLEDGIFLAHALSHARSVALLCDRDYYFKERRHDRGNISRAPFSPYDYVESLRIMASTLADHDLPDEDRRAAVLMIYRTRALRFLEGARLLRQQRRRRRRWFDAVALFAAEFIDLPLQQQLPPLERLRSDLARHRDERGLMALARLETEGGTPVVTASPRGAVVQLPGRTCLVEGLLAVGEPVVTTPLD